MLSSPPVKILLGMLISFACCATAVADDISITDVAGRQVTLDAPAERVILGEGRQIYLLGLLEPEDPFAHVVGWREDFSQADPDNYARYAERFPEIEDIPTFGGFKDGTFDVEQAAALNPDVVLMNIEAKAATEDAAYDDKLAQLGIPIVYVDFREDPLEHTIPSMRIIGQIMDDEEAAEAFIEFAETELARVTDVIAEANPERPSVFIDRAGGYSDECCMSFGPANFGDYVTLAGGSNIAEGIIPNSFGNLNPEQIIAANPDHVVVTGGNWDAYVPGGDWVGVGPGSDMQQAHAKLEALTERTAMTGIKAVESGNFHAIWHQFYNSPYYFVAVQQLAKWLHPELFEDLDPNATMEELHERFLPIDYEPGYWISLHDD
ncbi:ABC transporter substrate-binding protein [Halomonas sp. ISL-60]|uniref:ABC transporter substrate-binding protein n=1 Tax=Halomonas sp. ISL-56 TaxID=2819149 RepID=UPI001BE930DE|nr:ABC transporter substrate-binding protein [Halomonas sp. ISL-56]MBT2771872.1 ABC transporter substrate-binding protein [Halomonas sp. ISL-60]MBT2800163.1 ABC transporter substrate-binding protein [Halomonas sp. ISL-56]